MKRVRRFGLYWYEFIVGDDWRIAGGLALALGCTALLASQGLAAWWLLPVAVVALLAASIRRAIRQTSYSPSREARGVRT